MKLECVSAKDSGFRFNVLMEALNTMSWVMLRISFTSALDSDQGQGQFHEEKEILGSS